MCAQFVNSFIECICRCLSAEMPWAWPSPWRCFIFKIAVTDCHVESVCIYAEADQIEHYLHRPQRRFFVRASIFSLSNLYCWPFIYHTHKHNFWLPPLSTCSSSESSSLVQIYVLAYLSETVLRLDEFVSFLLEKTFLHQMCVILISSW